MKKTDLPFDKAKAMFDPASFFKNPMEIVNYDDTLLSMEEKIQALKTWELDIRLNDIAVSENMPEFYRARGQTITLEDVHLAREKLGDFTGEHSPTSILGM